MFNDPHDPVPVEVVERAHLIELHRQGKLPFDRLVKTYPLDDINHAIADQHDGKCVKVVLLTGQD